MCITHDEMKEIIEKPIKLGIKDVGFGELESYSDNDYKSLSETLQKAYDDLIELYAKMRDDRDMWIKKYQSMKEERNVAVTKCKELEYKTTTRVETNDDGDDEYDIDRFIPMESDKSENEIDILRHDLLNALCFLKLYSNKLSEIEIMITKPLKRLITSANRFKDRMSDEWFREDKWKVT